VNDRIAPALTKALSEVKSVTNIKLRQCNISPFSLKKMLDQVSVQVLDVSGNPSLAQFDFANYVSMRTLKASHNQMTEIPSMAESILELSLSHNKLSDMEPIANLLNKNKIRWLDLGWN
jgi:Leucine-rich repeat (LRR) protein